MQKRVATRCQRAQRVRRTTSSFDPCGHVTRPHGLGLARDRQSAAGGTQGVNKQRRAQRERRDFIFTSLSLSVRGALAVIASLTGLAWMEC